MAKPDFESSALVREKIVDNLRTIGRVVDYAKGETIFRAGDPMKGVLFVIDGAVGSRTFVNDDGKEFTPYVARPIEVVGAEDLFEKDYHATAQALEPSSVIVVKRADLQTAMVDDQQLAEYVLTALTLQTTRQQEKYLVAKSGVAEDRVVGALLDINGEPINVSSRTTGATIASVAGMTRYYAARLRRGANIVIKQMQQEQTQSPRARGPRQLNGEMTLADHLRRLY